MGIMFDLKHYTKPKSINLGRQANNFDFIRLLAACLVIISHSSILLYNKPLSFDPVNFLLGLDMGRLGVIIFFIISGFLITKSWENKTHILGFISARFLRIYPAAIFVVLTSILLLGIIVSPLSFKQYIQHELTHKYLQNISLFRMYYYLPGVFSSNLAGSSVNGSLWTLPYEITCYMFLALFGILKVFKNSSVFIAVFIILLGAEIIFAPIIDKIILPALGIDFKTFYPLWLYFLSGAIYYKLKNTIKFTFVGAFIVIALLFITKDLGFATILKVVLLPYFILFVAFSNIKLNGIGQYGDFSYGLYLYAFPVQQLIICFNSKLNLFSMIILSVLFTFPFAYFSWNCIESPSLKIHKRLFKT